MDTSEGNLGDPESLHRYLYASADPVDRVDPSGNEDFSIASLSISMGVSGVLNAMATANRQSTLRSVATNFAIGALEGGAFYISGVGVVKLISQVRSLVMTAQLAARIDQAMALISDVSPELRDGIPKFFDLTTTAGKVHLIPNATKHLAEMAAAAGDAGATRTALAILYESVAEAAGKAFLRMVPYEVMVIEDGWEIIFSAPRAGEVLPVIKHLRYLL